MDLQTAPKESEEEWGWIDLILYGRRANWSKRREGRSDRKRVVKWTLARDFVTWPCVLKVQRETAEIATGFGSGTNPAQPSVSSIGNCTAQMPRTCVDSAEKQVIGWVNLQSSALPATLHNLEGIDARSILRGLGC